MATERLSRRHTGGPGTSNLRVAVSRAGHDWHHDKASTAQVNERTSSGQRLAEGTILAAMRSREDRSTGVQRPLRCAAAAACGATSAPTAGLESFGRIFPRQPVRDRLADVAELRAGRPAQQGPQGVDLLVDRHGRDHDAGLRAASRVIRKIFSIAPRWSLRRLGRRFRRRGLCLAQAKDRDHFAQHRGLNLQALCRRR